MRRTILWGLALYAALPLSAKEQPAPVDATVFRSPACGCCKKWVEHLQANGFAVKDIVKDDMAAVKRELGVPEHLASCHTAVIGGYRIEGHVPAADIHRLLDTKAPLLGLSVPGMPVGTPGMEAGGRKDAYSVLGFGPGDSVQSVHDYAGTDP
ncbi:MULTISPECIES: DUF411 domain-containing protein [Methylococcus]|uniref:DUF411 domain-containing protein n=1 Tax=Methylococcus capsulatus TaxID=414 RepID=A0ABZ2F6S7_METCP|nr:MULTISPECIES: DUF411 domain-containing protein [Methylococcus]MDF9393464.1 DUF411 domain-containing protein [Methylococcus capsulatus]